MNTSYPIQNLIPNNAYTYSVESMRSGVVATAINTMQLHTSALDIPEISDATDVQPNQFTANWGASPYASGYLLNVYKVSGQADTTEVEGFNSVGTNGTPLPTGWTGTASGNYTTAASTGIASPSVAFKNAKEWLQTKTYPQAVSKLSFMYRFATYVAGASLLIDGQSNGSWTRIDSIICKNNTKITQSYSFDKLQGLKAFKFTFNKMPGGNMALDDVSATYGNQDTVYVQKNLAATANSALVQNLTENTQYYYAVRATLGSSVSGVSETIGVHTPVKTSVADLNTSSIRIVSEKEQISISGLHGDETVQIYSMTGNCLYQAKTASTNLSIAFRHQGIFIVKVQNAGYQFTGKVIH